MDKKKAEELLVKYLEDNCTPEEKLLVESWYNTAMDNQDPLPGTPDFRRLREEIYRRLPQPGETRRMWHRYAAASAVLLVMLLGALYFYTGNDHSTPAAREAALENDIAPGGDIAVLTLADGSRIQLNETKNGMLAMQGHTHIVKLDSGRLAYQSAGQVNEPPVYNTLETPRGGQYRIILPDGTKVWLNAASSITYPTAFNAGKRTVEITGEVYFEVAPDKNKPFLVRSGTQEVQVLGTHFNINAYQDEGSVRTTLMEGSIKVSNLSSNVSRLLVPGEQSALRRNSLSVEEVDVEEAAAWKNGYFMFVNDENIRSIMRKVARWYNVDVAYEGNMEEVDFTGTVSRFANVSVLLEKLQLTGMVRFKIEGRNVMVISNEK